MAAGGKGRRVVPAIAIGLGLLAAGSLETAGAQEQPAFPTTVFEDGARAAAVAVGELVAEVSLETVPEVDPYFDTPVLRVYEDGKPVLEFPGVASGFDFPTAEASIAEIDPANGGPDVFFASYSGGAHCCTQVVVATRTGSHWTTVPLGEFDGDGGRLEDLNDDGVAEILTYDNRFLYRFGCYACSAAPMVVIGVREGRAVDLSAGTDFLPAHREWLDDLETTMEPADRWSSAGYLAGWVAAKIRVGEGEEAWDALRKNWDFANDQGEEVCLTGEELDDCRDRDLAVLSFPERLVLFLKQTGYMT